MIQELIITIGARPHVRALTYGDCRTWISQLPDDDLADIRVWRVYSMVRQEASTDATADFVADWARRVEQATRPGLRPNYPDFVWMHLPVEWREIA
jgi:hypothetical protein